MSVIKVVLADDHPLVLRGTADFLQQAPDISVVACCSDGPQALKAICELKPDIAVLDLSMPGLSGLDVISALRRERLRTRTILLCAFINSRDVIAAMAEGVHGLLLKDSDPEQLLHSIRAAALGEKRLPFDVVPRAEANTERRAPTPIESVLTQREWLVMAYAAEGLPTKEIARRLNIASGTAKVHLHRIYRKLGVQTRAALAHLAVRYRDKSRV